MSGNVNHALGLFAGPDFFGEGFGFGGGTSGDGWGGGHVLGSTTEMGGRCQWEENTAANDTLEVREHPSVIFRVNNNSWLEAIVRYVVIPREAGRVKTRLIKKLLAKLNAAPDKVMFPAGANR